MTMSQQTVSPKNLILFIMVTAVAAFRLLTHFNDHLSPLTNFTPVGAIALFGGACFKGRTKPFLFPLLALFISDLVLSFTVYAPLRSGLLYMGWYWTYGAFALMVVAGKLLLKKPAPAPVFFSVLAATLIHWLVSDIGGCLSGSTVQARWALYLQRLVTALPYEWRFFSGTLIYTILMFGTLVLAQKKSPVLRPE
jgi:hypothetical protein